MTGSEFRDLVFLLEEPSAKDLLEGLLPRLVKGTWIPRFLVFEGKQDLEKRMVRRLRHYRKPQTRFVVMRDQDSGDCASVKGGLVARCDEAGRPETLVRIACRELEAWILGDLEAFAEEFDRPAAARAATKYLDPDAVEKPVDVLRKFHPEYQKRDGARRMGIVLDPRRNRSVSFRVFCSGIRKLTEH